MWQRAPWDTAVCKQSQAESTENHWFNFESFIAFIIYLIWPGRIWGSIWNSQQRCYRYSVALIKRKKADVLLTLCLLIPLTVLPRPREFLLWLPFTKKRRNRDGGKYFFTELHSVWIFGSLSCSLMLVLGSLNPDFWLYLGFYLNHVTLLKNEPGVCSWVLTFIILSERMFM